MAMSKNTKAMRAMVDPNKQYALTDAIEIILSQPKRKFVEGVDIAVNLGVDPKKPDQNVRNATVLPHGTGKTVRVAVFAQGAQADAAKDAGADIVGAEDLADTIKGGTMDFDVLIATPDMMRLVGQLGQVLGPRGLMPNPKVGTVTPDVANAVTNAKAGQVRYRTDKNGIIHATVGKVNFDANQLKENIQALIADLRKVKPSNSKGVYLKKIAVSSTMGPGVVIDVTTIEG